LNEKENYIKLLLLIDSYFNIEGKDNCKAAEQKKNVLFLNEKSEENQNYKGFFSFYMIKFLKCAKKNEKNYKLYKTISYMRDHINDKFDLLKYYKQIIHYKYLKKIILSYEQRNAVRNICNLKTDNGMIYKNSKKKFYEESDKDINKLKLHLGNDIIDERIRKLIDMKFS